MSASDAQRSSAGSAERRQQVSAPNACKCRRRQRVKALQRASPAPPPAGRGRRVHVPRAALVQRGVPRARDRGAPLGTGVVGGRQQQPSSVVVVHVSRRCCRPPDETHLAPARRRSCRSSFLGSTPAARSPRWRGDGRGCSACCALCTCQTHHDDAASRRLSAGGPRRGASRRSRTPWRTPSAHLRTSCRTASSATPLGRAHRSLPATSASSSSAKEAHSLRARGTHAALAPVPPPPPLTQAGVAGLRALPPPRRPRPPPAAEALRLRRPRPAPRRPGPRPGPRLPRALAAPLRRGLLARLRAAVRRAPVVRGRLGAGVPLPAPAGGLCGGGGVPAAAASRGRRGGGGCGREGRRRRAAAVPSRRAGCKGASVSSLKTTSARAAAPPRAAADKGCTRPSIATQGDPRCPPEQLRAWAAHAPEGGLSVVWFDCAAPGAAAAAASAAAAAAAGPAGWWNPHRYVLDCPGQLVEYLLQDIPALVPPR